MSKEKTKFVLLYPTSEGPKELRGVQFKDGVGVVEDLVIREKLIKEDGCKEIFILRHPTEGYTGMWGPVGFENGRGSTSSRLDRNHLVKFLGCKDISAERVEILREQRRSSRA